MPRVRTDLFSLLTAALVITASSYACGSEDEPLPGVQPETGQDGGGDGQPAPANSFDDALAKLTVAVCKMLFECPTTNDEVGGLRVMFTSAEDCANRMRNHWMPSQRVFGPLARLAHLASLAANGTMSIDPAALDACVKGMVEECRSIVACDTVFAGTASEGDACSVNEACKSGLYCKSAASESCAGKCAPRISIGSPCTNARGECEAGALCGDGSLCTARFNSAIERVGLDQPCDLDPNGKNERLCQAGLFCQSGASAGPNTCRAPLAANAPCNGTFTDVCVAGHLCLKNTGGSPTCRPVALGAAGEGCAMSMTIPDIRPCNPWTGLACLPDGKCGPGGGADQPILRIFDEETCIEGFAAGTDDKCHVLQVADAACTRRDQCESGSCNTTVQKCRDAYCE